jgi:hypothetical protein
LERLGGRIERDRARVRREQRQVATGATSQIEGAPTGATDEPPPPPPEAAALTEAAEGVVDPGNLLDSTHRDGLDGYAVT